VTIAWTDCCTNQRLNVNLAHLSLSNRLGVPVNRQCRQRVEASHHSETGENMKACVHLLICL